MLSVIRAAKEKGLGVIFISHTLPHVLEVTDRVVVMNAGKEIFGGRLAEAVQDPRVIEVYFGADHD